MEVPRTGTVRYRNRTGTYLMFSITIMMFFVLILNILDSGSYRSTLYGLLDQDMNQEELKSWAKKKKNSFSEELIVRPGRWLCCLTQERTCSVMDPDPVGPELFGLVGSGSKTVFYHIERKSAYFCHPWSDSETLDCRVGSGSEMIWKAQ